MQGVNRAFPYVSSEEADDIVEAQTPILFKLVSHKLDIATSNVDIELQVGIIVFVILQSYSFLCRSIPKILM